MRGLPPSPAGRPGGLSSAEAAARLATDGPNAPPEDRPHPIAAFLRKFWSPIPWMLEIAAVLELLLGRRINAGIIVALLLLNATLSLVQERRAAGALALLRRRLRVDARVLRDGRWQLLPARDLVAGDLVHLRLGDLVPADVRLLDGALEVDHSALTGESLPVEVGPGGSAFAGGLVRRGEASAEVTATGVRSRFGKTAELVRGADPPSHLEGVIFGLVRALMIFEAAVVAAVLAYALYTGLPLHDLGPFALILLIASVPVALPATSTLATALGSLELARRGVLVARLAAIEEAAAIDVFLSDKTGTLTRNELALAAVHAYAPCGEEDVVRLAALASDEATQDPIDLAVVAAARARGSLTAAPERLSFVPFEPATRRSETVVRDGAETLRVVKGAPAAVAALVRDGPDWRPDAERLSTGGRRVLAVAAGRSGALSLAGLIALEDPPREDAADLIARLRELGVAVKLVSGDGLATARALAERVGIGGRACRPAEKRTGGGDVDPTCDVFAEVFPEDKVGLVRALQRAGHEVGMTGDGVNDAPALRQAEVGIAVANATDVAKAAAGMVLTGPGLENVVAAIETGRRIYQRMLTYTLNKIVKTFVVALFLGLGLVATGKFVTTGRLVLLLLFANDFVTMSLATDRVSFSRRPDRWDIRTLAASGLALAALWLCVAFAVFLAGRDFLGLDLPRLQTLTFLFLVFSGQATVYLVRERGPFWRSRPSVWLVLTTLADIVAVSGLAISGFLMAPLAPAIVAAELGVTAVAMLGVDLAKIGIFRRLDVH